MLSLLSLLTACSPLSFDAHDVDADASEDDEAAALEGDELVATSRARGPSLTVDPDLAGDAFVELRSYRRDGDGVPAWSGVQLYLAPVSDGSKTFSLPAAPPRRDRAGTGEPVVYSISLRAADDDGAPGAYVGVADAELVFFSRGAAPSGAADGWNLVEGYGVEGEDPRYVPFDEPLALRTSLIAEGSLSIGGVPGFPIDPNTHVTVATPDFASGLSILDAPLTGDWSATLDVAPPAETYVDGIGALFNVYAYNDDGDGVWDGETVAARACDGSEEVMVSWGPNAYDLVTALKLRSVGMRSGWDLVSTGPTGTHGVPAERRDLLILSPTCTVASPD